MAVKLTQEQADELDRKVGAIPNKNIIRKNIMLCDIGVERALICSLVQGGKSALLDIEDIGVTDLSFTQTSNQALFSSIKYLLSNNDCIDQSMLLITLKNLGYIALFDSKKDIEYIASLFMFPVDQKNVRALGIRLEKLVIARKAIGHHNQAIEDLSQINGTENIEHIIQLSENPIFDLIAEVSKNKNSGPKLLFENIEEIVAFLKTNPCDAIGIQTPWKCYNAAIGSGLRRGGVNLISSRVKIGKTTIAKEAILHFTNTLKIPALMLDTEMVLQDQLIRSLASTSNVSLSDVESGRFAKHVVDNQKIDKAVKQLKQNKLFWYESVAGKKFEEILATIRRWIVKEVGYDGNGRINDCVVVYDYFKLMDKGQMDNIQEYQAMGFQISRLTDFCKEFDFPCLAFVQLNRQNDISQSDRLRWLCHSYTTFAKKEPQEEVDDGPQGGNRKMIVLDTRFGAGIDSDDYICMNFQRNINKITEVGLKSKKDSWVKEPADREFEVDYDQQGKSEFIDPLRLEFHPPTDVEPPWDTV
jgi:replicative DNA helicase